MVKAPVWVLLGIVPLLSSAGSEAACLPKQTRDCVINLDAVPQISQEIVRARMPADVWQADGAPSSPFRTCDRLDQAGVPQALAIALVRSNSRRRICVSGMR